MTAWRWVALFSIVGAAVRFTGLRSDLWLDEIATLVVYLRLPPWEAMTHFESPNQHMLYSVVGSVSLRVFGESAWSARFPAALLGSATIPLFYAVARRWLAEWPALLATLLLALNYHHVWFSQSARGYAPMMFFVVAATWFAQRDREHPRGISNGVGYAIAAAAAVLSVQTAMFLIAAQMLVYGRRILFSGLAGGALALLGTSPALPAMLRYYATEDRSEFGASVTEMVGTLARFLWSGLAQGFMGAGALVVLAALVFGGLRVAREHPEFGRTIVVAIAIHAAAMIVLHYGGYPRYGLYLLPFGMIAAAAGISALQRHLWRKIAAAALLVASAGGLWINWQYPKQNYRGTLAWVRSKAAPGDRIAGAGLAGKFYRIYHAPELPQVDTLAELEALAGAGGRRWIIYSFPADMRRRFAPLYDEIQNESRWEPAGEFRGTVGGGTMYVVRSKP